MLKQKTQYGILSIIIIALLGFVLPSFWKYQAKQLGVNPNYFHIGNNLVDFANLTTYSLFPLLYEINLLKKLKKSILMKKYYANFFHKSKRCLLFNL